NNIWYPAKFFDSFHNTSNKENATLVIIVIFITVFVNKSLPILKVIFVIYKINLHSSRLNRSDFYDERIIRVVNNKVHTRKANNFVQLISTFINTSKLRHKSTYFHPFFLDSLRQIS